MQDRLKRAAPLIGAVLMVALVVVALSMPQSPDSKASGEKVIAFYAKHRTAMNVAAFCLAYAGAVSLLFFTSVAGFLRQRGSQLLATLTGIGGVIFAAGLLVAAGLVAAANDAVHHQAAAAAQALNIVQNGAFAPLLFAGLGVATLCAGVAMLRTKALPKALGIIATIVGVATLSGIGSWFGFLASGPLVLVIAGYVYARSGASSQITLPDVPGQRQVAETPTKATTA